MKRAQINKSGCSLPELAAGGEHLHEGAVLFAEELEQSVPHRRQAGGVQLQVAQGRELGKRALKLEAGNC